MLPDAGKIEFSHARRSLGVDLNAVKSSLPGIAALDDLYQNIENLICLCIDSRIASAVFLRDNDRSAAARPSAFIVSRLILPEASFYLENSQSNERKANAKPRDVDDPSSNLDQHATWQHDSLKVCSCFMLGLSSFC
jgi:hypothetical protein